MKFSKKLIAGTLVLTMMSLMMASCKTETGSELKVRSKGVTEETETTEDTTYTSAAVSEVEPTETEPSETEPVPTEFPDMQYFNYPKVAVEYDYVTDEDSGNTIRHGNIYLTDASKEKYPDLYDAILDYQSYNTEDNMFTIIGYLQDGYENPLSCYQDIIIARADNEIFSFATHYTVFETDPTESVFEYVEAFTYESETGYELGFDDLFVSDIDADTYVEKKFGLTDVVDIYYLVDNAGVTVISSTDGYDPENPVSFRWATEVYTPETADTFRNSYIYSTQDCVMPFVRWDVDFVGFNQYEGSVSRAIYDQTSGSVLDAEIVFGSDSSGKTANFKVTDLASSEVIVDYSVSGMFASPKPYLICSNDGEYAFVLECSGFDGISTIYSVPFNLNGMIPETHVEIEGALSGLPELCEDDPHASDAGLVYPVCGSIYDIYLHNRMDMMGTYDVADNYFLSPNMILSKNTQPSYSMTYFGSPMKTKMDFEFTDENSSSKVTLPSGTELYIVLSDYKNGVVYFTDMGKKELYSLTYEDRDRTFPWIIDGVEETEIFEEVYYNLGL
ncbi:MAG: hypothetical protein J6127_08455 [Clostridiales bacterium]|nr:hypothetical protein [Clostridiales bacterium]